ncbi:MAG: NAD-dependent 4,6-dehydratase LegB [Nitrococcus sp.]|nr:NAD-dependent 4,6-dehydratase LegB [Nitrococcus sp.]
MGKVLVTGADGFIGSHLVEQLIREGYDVRAFVFYNSFDSRGWLDHCATDVYGEFEVFAGDVRDPFCVRDSMQGCDAVLHLAALIGIPFSYIAPANYVATNVSGTLNVVQAARDLGGINVIHTSTSEVYGTAQVVPITENHPLQGQSPYAATKIAADQIAYSFYLSFGQPVTILRPFNTYGPRQSARAVIPTIISQIANGRTQLNLGSLSPTRDFNFVADTVRGFIAALSADTAVGQVINLGSGYEVTVGDLVQMIADIFGTKVTIETDEKRLRPEKSEVERLCAANSRAAELLGWKPQFGGLEGLRKGLEQTVEWFSDPANLAAYRPDQYTV